MIRILPLILIAIAAAVPGPASATEVHALRGEPTGPRTLTFAAGDLRPAAVENVRLQVGPVRRRISPRSLRRLLASGRVRIHVSARTAQAARSSRPTLLVGTRRFSSYDGFSTSGGSLTSTRSRAYDGSRSIRASYGGAKNTTFQRVWRDVHWGEGSDVWYGMALRIPDVSAYCYWNPVRWDNYKSFGPGGDVGGLAIERNRLSVFRNDYGGTEQKLISNVSVPQNRWFWVELHQHLSSTIGVARTELYLNRRLVGTSLAANSRGREIDQLRFGAVDVASSCSRPGSVFFDRADFSDGPRGPLTPSR